jgi:hypothetical protein
MYEVPRREYVHSMRSSKACGYTHLSTWVIRGQLLACRRGSQRGVCVALECFRRRFRFSTGQENVDRRTEKPAKEYDEMELDEIKSRSLSFPRTERRL